MASQRNILVVAAHPDDEILGCGGAIARLAEAGATVNILIVAEGAASRDGGAVHDEIAQLQRAAAQAAQILGAQPPRMLGLPDNRLDSLPLLDVIKPIERAVTDIAPDTVFTHHGGDLNIDHRIVHQAVMTACRPLPGGTVRRIVTFETVSSTEWGGSDPASAFAPNLFVDVSATLERKRRALESYAMEMRSFPHARSWESVESLARHRGASAGLQAAEAFMTIREIEP